jgi:hypothetical protein
MRHGIYALGVLCFSACLSLAPRAFAVTFIAGPGIVIAGECGQTGTIAGQLDMQLGFFDLSETISQVAAGLNLGQEDQSSVMGQIAQQVDTSYTNTVRQRAVAQMEDSIQNGQPVDENGNQVRVVDACGYTGTSGASLGVVSGDLANSVAGSAILSSLETYNTGTAGTMLPYTARLAAMAPNDLDPGNVLGSTDGGTGNTHYSPDQVRGYISAVTNPLPLPALPSALNATAAGQKYAALAMAQHAGMDLPQEVLTGIAQMNAPFYPVETWADQQIATLASSNGTLSSGLQAQVAAGAENGAISENNFLSVMNSLRLENPQWWTEIDTSTSDLDLEQQIAETDAVRVDVAYRNLILTERQAAMLATQVAQQTNNTIGPEATELRNEAIAASITNSSAIP